MTHVHPNPVEHHKRSREEIAKAEIGHTDSTRAINWFLFAVCILAITVVPVMQNIVEFRNIRSGQDKTRKVPQSWDVFSFLLPQRQELKAVAGAPGIGGKFEVCRQINNRMLADIIEYEKGLKDRDVMIQWLIPRMQSFITGLLKGGNEDAYCGRDGWLFYRKDIDSLTGRAFLDPQVLQQRAMGGSELKAPPQPDPRKAILDFNRQLAERGIKLIVMPAPVKASLYPECHSDRYAGRKEIVQNPSFETWKAELEKAGVCVFDPAPVLAEAKAQHPDVPLYLKTDTHWTPAGMELTATRLAEAVRKAAPLPAPIDGRYITVEQSITNLGDIAMMLKLPADQRVFAPETVKLHRVVDGDHYWRPSTNAEVLFLGDSFANIFSMKLMKWGQAAGLAEHLSLALGLPVDTLCRNDQGSFVTREALSKLLDSGSDRLAGKKVVVWEFASRELACGDWKMLAMKVGQPKGSGFYAPAPGRSVEIQGVVRAVTPVPRPGTVPYKDHIFSLHLTGIESADDPSANGREALVFAWSMCDNVATKYAGCRVGQTVKLRVQPWSDVAQKYESINRSEFLDDPQLATVMNQVWVVSGDQTDENEVPPVVAPIARKPAQGTSGGATAPGTGPQAPTGAAATPAQGGFFALCAKLAAEGDAMAIPGRDGWLFLRSELRHISVGPFWGADAVKVSKATAADKADPLPAILDFNEQLKAMGIELILAPVPCKALIYPEELPGGSAERMDTNHQQFFKLLGDKGVKVLDLASLYWQEKAKPGTPLLYCKTDSHWSPYACELAAKQIKALLGSPAWLQGKPDNFKTTAETRTITGDLTDGKGSETLPIRLVKGPSALIEDKASPVVVMGDSHTLVFHAGADMHGTGAGLADQLAAELGRPVDIVGVRGSGATPARINLLRRAKADPTYLAGKKVIIWCFTAREFTESTSGWMPLKLK